MDKNKFLIDLSESKRTDFGKVDFAEQSDEQKVFTTVWMLESEVNNGGFAQYFDNDRGETVGLAVAALQQIGANQCASIVERAIGTVCGGAMPPDAHGWETVIAGISDESGETLDGLDAEFFKYPDNLTELLFEFVGAHPKVFGPIGTE